MESGVYYTSGDESEQVYWHHATGLTFHGGRSISTKWNVEQVLAQLGGITVTPLFVRRGKKDIATYVGRMDTPAGQSAILNLKYYEDRNSIYGHISAGFEEELSMFLGRIFDGIEEYEKVPEKDDGVFLHYTFSGEYGPDTITREISAPTWTETQGNYADSVQAAADVPRWLDAGDLVLLKGSRGMRLERVANAIADFRAPDLTRWSA